MAGQLLETLFVELVFKGDRRELDRANRKLRDLGRQLQGEEGGRR